MRIEVTANGNIEIIPLPDDIDHVGVVIPDKKFFLNSFLDSDACELTIDSRVLSDGTKVDFHLYRFLGAAKVMSMKGYEGLVNCELALGSIQIKIIV